MKKKSKAQLDREIREALASSLPRRRLAHVGTPPAKPKPPAWMVEINERASASKRAGHGSVLRAIRKAPVAIVMKDRSGRETLAIVTREMSRPEEGAWRASVFWRDGPVGHITRKTLGTVAKELASDYAPKSVRVVGDDVVMEWTGSDEFAEGSKRVAEVQAWNEGRR